jgi:hypothetical protein
MATNPCLRPLRPCHLHPLSRTQNDDPNAIHITNDAIYDDADADNANDAYPITDDADLQ